MSFRGQDFEAIQKAAGLLGFTYDELIRLQELRTQHESIVSSGGATPVQTHRELSPGAYLDQVSAAAGLSLANDSSHAAHPAPLPSPGVAPTAGESFAVHHGLPDRSPLNLAELANIHLPSPVAPADELPDDSFKRILLNPQSVLATFECDLGYSADPALYDLLDNGEYGGTPIDLDWLTNDSSGNGDGTSSFVQLTPAGSNSEIYSQVKAAPQGDETHSGSDGGQSSGGQSRTPSASTSWSLVPRPAPSRKSSFQPIAPKPGTLSLLECASRRGPPSKKERKKRGSYTPAKRTETKVTRNIGACVRCRVQRDRCIPDPHNLGGACLTCQRKGYRMSRLPCLRYKMMDCKLFRTGLPGSMTFYQTHLMVGGTYGDFHMKKKWTGAPSRYLSLGQLGDASVQIELHEFVPPANSKDTDLKGRSMYAVPWAIRDPHAVVAIINEYLDHNIGLYIDARLDKSDSVVWNVFQAAWRASILPYPNQLLRKTIRLWVACRFIESGWRCWGDDAIAAANPKDPFYEWSSPPPYLDYQIASIIIQRILVPLSSAVLQELQTIVTTPSRRTAEWYSVFLVTFILLHNYEVQMLFQLQFAQRRKARVRYLDMPLVRATNSGAKTILAHFHYGLKGHHPFQPSFDWRSKQTQSMANLNPDETEFLESYRSLVIQNSSSFEEINHSDQYHQRYWYTSQLFEANWVPRETLEHAPVVEPSE